MYVAVRSSKILVVVQLCSTVLCSTVRIFFYCMLTTHLTAPEGNLLHVESYVKGYLPARAKETPVRDWMEFSCGELSQLDNNIALGMAHRKWGKCTNINHNSPIHAVIVSTNNVGLRDGQVPRQITPTRVLYLNLSLTYLLLLYYVH